MAPPLEFLLDTVAARIIAAADELTALDSAIGDADHGLNMKRGFEAVLAEKATILAKPLGEALKTIGMTLVMKVGGASGPLYGTLFMTLGKELPAEPTVADLARALHAGRRGAEGARQGRLRQQDHAGCAGARGAASCAAARRASPACARLRRSGPRRRSR